MYVLPVLYLQVYQTWIYPLECQLKRIEMALCTNSLELQGLGSGPRPVEDWETSTRRDYQPTVNAHSRLRETSTRRDYQPTVNADSRPRETSTRRDYQPAHSRPRDGPELGARAEPVDEEEVGGESLQQSGCYGSSRIVFFC